MSQLDVLINFNEPKQLALGWKTGGTVLCTRCGRKTRSVQLTLVELTTTKSELIQQKRGEEPDGAELTKLSIYYSVLHIQTRYRWHNQFAHIKSVSKANQLFHKNVKMKAFTNVPLNARVQMNNNPEPDDVSDIVKWKKSGHGGRLNGN